MKHSKARTAVTISTAQMLPPTHTDQKPHESPVLRTSGTWALTEALGL